MLVLMQFTEMKAENIDWSDLKDSKTSFFSTTQQNHYCTVDKTTILTDICLHLYFLKNLISDKTGSL